MTALADGDNGALIEEYETAEELAEIVALLWYEQESAEDEAEQDETSAQIWEYYSDESI